MGVVADLIVKVLSCRKQRPFLTKASGKQLKILILRIYCEELELLFKELNLVSFREKMAETIGEAKDLGNQKILEEMRKNDSFDWRPLLVIMKKSRFEEVR